MSRTAIPGATSSSYLVDAADIGSTLDCDVVAHNAGGASAPATSNATDVIPGSFSPLDIPGIQYYGKVSTLGLADNDPISSLIQLSAGTGSDATSAAANRPTFKASVAAFGNKDVARFNGTNRLTGTVTIGTTKAWAFMVCSVGATTNVNGRILTVGKIGVNDFNDVAYFFIDRSGALESIDAFRNFAISNAAIVYDQPFIVIVRYDGTNGFISVDGGSETSAASSGTFAGENFRIADFIANDSYGSSLVGDVAEVAFGIGDLTPTDISNLVAYAQAEYGL